MQSAREIVLSETSRAGTISFARFMEIALYHPDVGYYSTGRAVIGKSGDFYTNVSVGSIFARILYTQFEEVWTALGQPQYFPLVEFGAHNGLFASDILQLAAEHGTRFSKCLEYHIVEHYPKLREVQHNTLHPWPHRIHSRVKDLPPFQGIIFANELLDAFPCHLVQWSGSQWMEHRIKADVENLRFISTEITDPLLNTLTHAIPLPLPPGYTTEVCPSRTFWLKQISQRLTRGILLFADYGYPRREFFAPHRISGTLACYRRHRRTNNPLIHIGQQDLTAHVEFTSFAEAAEQYGLTFSGFTDQHHFLTAAAEPWLRSLEGKSLSASTQSDLRHLQTLLHPTHMGSHFHFLAFARGLVPPILSGFRYSTINKL